MTETLTYRNVDKTSWSRGPWDAEPDKEQWADPATGLPCLIKRNPHLGHLCGYVGVSPGHPAYGQDADDVAADAHGGLNYAGGCSHGDPAHSICHVPSPGEPDDVWWLGFDCGHGGDVAPNAGPASWTWEGAVYRDWDYVRGQVTRLAQQLKELAP